VFAIVEAAGWPIWFLLVTSVVALALIIERGVALRRTKIVPPGLLQGTIAEFRRSGASDDLLVRLDAHSPLGRVFAAGLRNHKSSREIMKESIEDAGRAVEHELGRYLTTLGTIAAIAPLMGLFGTIIGMIQIFGAATGIGHNPQELAQGISVALYSTGFGLIIAIPALICHRHFRAFVEGCVVDMEQQAIRLVEILHGERA